MMVIFLSQCEKKALHRTRRVLDAFANRIGDHTWQTVITQEGLIAVKKLLRKTASKNTGVSCHWIRGRSRSELLWVVGKRDKFNKEGAVPVNITAKNISNNQWENNWHYLPLIRIVTALAALFHDWGKATIYFQKKLRKKLPPDPIRHEWVSCLLFHAFVHCRKTENSEKLKDDIEWLDRLSVGDFDEDALTEVLKTEKTTKPLSDLPPLATMVSWLILGHHRLPLPENNEDFDEHPLYDYKELFDTLVASWGYENKSNKKIDCLTFAKGLLKDSSPWIKEVKKWARKASKGMPLLKKIENDKDIWRIVLFHARLSLMLGDHNYSSLPASKKWKKSQLFANTKDKKLDQQLDEHLVNVSWEALKVVEILPRFENSFHAVEDIKNLEYKSPKNFEWQDKAVTKIIEWRKNKKISNDQEFGFFAVNMASTGKGKTFANAKIMRALSLNGESLRYILALGLRTLTLQTGDEYKKRLKIEDALAVLIGSKAVMELHNKQKSKEELSLEEEGGSESREELLREELVGNGYCSCDIPEERLKTVLKKEKDRVFLYTPVLVCTIDHIMGATETIRGGRYILPTLRLMSSDLVIDEVDDFDVNDLKAIGRLVHLVGMLGRKMMISSATIPPDLAKGFFHAYCEGWKLFAKTRGVNGEIGCAWIDEFKTKVKTVKTSEPREYPVLHDQFIEFRVKELQEEVLKRRKVEIVTISDLGGNNQECIEEIYFESIKNAIVKMHERHLATDEISKKQVSFGVVRMANIAPCVNLTKYFLKCEWPKNIEIKTMCYHAQQVLLMRNEQEKHLDKVLKRNKTEKIFEDEIIKKQLSDSSVENVIYILIATPVEEVGRDHDFDWAVVEPSSYRSIIQLAGRVLRHRNKCVSKPNIALMQYNLKGLQQKYSNCKKRTPVFSRPGYENSEYIFDSHDLKKLLDEERLKDSVDAIPRIKYNSKKLCPKKYLVDLEHEVIRQSLNTIESQGARHLEGWFKEYWWLTGIPQRLYRFRNSLPSENVYLMPSKDGSKYEFYEKDNKGKMQSSEDKIGIEHEDCEDYNGRLWLKRDYANLLNKIVEQQEGMTEENAARRYGELSLTQYKNYNGYIYSPQFGLTRK